MELSRGMVIFQGGGILEDKKIRLEGEELIR